MMTCSKCPATVKWVSHEKKIGTETRTSRLIIDAEPSERGNILVANGTGRVLTHQDLAAARAAGTPLHISHFATCPQAASFRKAGKQP